MHHGIPFLLEENSILQIPISSNNPSTSRAPCAPRYEEGVAGDTQPVRPGGRWGGGVPSWRKSVSEAPIAASVTSVSRMRRERRLAGEGAAPVASVVSGTGGCCGKMTRRSAVRQRRMSSRYFILVDS